MQGSLQCNMTLYCMLYVTVPGFASFLRPAVFFRGVFHRKRSMLVKDGSVVETFCLQTDRLRNPVLPTSKRGMRQVVEI